MSDNIINLDDHRPHQTSYVACLDCGKDWIAVAPANTFHFQCPDCLKLSGLVVDPQCPHFINAFMRPAKRKADKKKRTMVVLNAARMIKEKLAELEGKDE
jgi:DNA-directed RNA polymerase subunit RPC12/RpoP